MALPKFRFHLSTAILLMFAAGGLIGLNMQRRFAVNEVASTNGWVSAEFRFGLPVRAFEELGSLHLMDLAMTEVEGRQFVELFELQNPFKKSDAQFINGQGIFVRQKAQPGEFILTGIVINCLSGLTILLLVGFVSEYIIHRRTKRSALSTQDSALSRTQDSALPL